jgi:protein-tyrosine phosphatase
VIDEADVVRDGDDLVVSWTGSAHVDGDGNRTVRLPGLAAGGRHYVRLEAPDGSAVVAAERHVPMEGPVNFRDLGGYAGRDGRRVRWGRVYRSDSLHQLTPADLELVDALGVRFVCDLRLDRERAEAPHPLEGHPEVQYASLPIGDRSEETKSMTERMLRGEIPEVTVQDMAGVYATILRAHADLHGAVISTASEPANLPLVVHCTAGKDRTGQSSALILSLLGVADDVIAEDYELSSRYHAPGRIAEVQPMLEAIGIDFAKVKVFFDAPGAVMAATLEQLRRDYGSIEDYLTGPAQVEPAAIERLRENLLD